MEKLFLGPNKIKHIMDIKILFIFVGNLYAHVLKKEQFFDPWKFVCYSFWWFPLYFFLSSPLIIVVSIVVCVETQTHIPKNAPCLIICPLYPFHSFQLSKPLNISWKMIFWELFQLLENPIVFLFLILCGSSYKIKRNFLFSYSS